MGVLDALVTGGLHASGIPGPTDDYWFTNRGGGVTAAGLKMDAAGARKMSAWYRGRDILATSLAMLPLQGYRRLPDDQGREVASSMPLYDTLHRKPNNWQDSFQWRREAMFDVIDHGWHYSKIIAGPRGFADRLERIDPTTVTPELVDTPALGKRWIFTVRDPKGGAPKTYTQDEVFYLRGADGKGILEYARDSLALGIVLENYASKLFARGAASGGFVESAGPMPDKDAMKRFAEQFLTPIGDWHMPKVIPFGAKFNATMMEPEKAQMILSRKFSVIDICRWLGLPAHMLNEVDTAGVTGLEQKGEEFTTFSLGGWLSMWEFAINDQLVLAPNVYYFEFSRDALSRGSLATRWAAYIGSVNAGIVEADEVRVKENLPKRGGNASKLREPQNITGRGAAGGPQDNQRPGREGDGADDSRAFAIVRSSAARALKLEVTAVQRLAVTNAANADNFAAAIAEFYMGHQARVTEMLQLSEAEASAYCANQALLVLGDWMNALEQFRTDDYVQSLAALALGEAA